MQTSGASCREKAESRLLPSPACGVEPSAARFWRAGVKDPIRDRSSRRASSPHEPGSIRDSKMSDSEMEKEIIEGLKPAEREPAQKALPIPNGLVGLVNHEQPCHRAVNFTAQYANLETVKPFRILDFEGAYRPGGSRTPSGLPFRQVSNRDRLPHKTSAIIEALKGPALLSRGRAVNETRRTEIASSSGMGSLDSNSAC